MAKLLKPYFPALDGGKKGYVAHECVIDLSQVKKTSGIINEDVTKRWIDYGFHELTMS
tara:strand:+ start:3212 stop:3385 length:174 start_codon:yes stop_codon:yes gene_type:complete